MFNMALKFFLAKNRLSKVYSNLKVQLRVGHFNASLAQEGGNLNQPIFSSSNLYPDNCQGRGG